MKQLFQPLDGGEAQVWEIDCPSVPLDWYLVKTHFSAVSPGTEKSLRDFAQASWLTRAKQRPDLVRKVIQKMSSEGIRATLEKVKARVQRPLPLGYSAVGEIVMSPVGGLPVGTMVACAGAGIANHAEFIAVPKNLCVPMSSDISLEVAATVALGAISLESVRCLEPRLGDNVVVLGGGVLGQLAAFLAEKSGCQVFLYDPQQDRGQNLRHGFSDLDQLKAAVNARTRGHGADGVIVAASTSSSVMPVAIDLLRLNGVVSVLGQVPMDFSRNQAYEKSITMKFSRSYGPGRYDHRYENQGVDYPYAYVRYAENRNMEAYLNLFSGGETLPFAYDVITLEQALGQHASLLQIVDFQNHRIQKPKQTSECLKKNATEPGLTQTTIKRIESFRKNPVIGWIGPGDFSLSTLYPIVKDLQIQIAGISVRDSSKIAQLRPLKNFSETDLIQSPVGGVLITTRHQNHGQLVIQALKAEKIVFCEKPLALNLADQDEIESLLRQGLGPVLVGHNRRFAAATTAVKNILKNSEAWEIVYQINAGALPPEHWTHDPLHGGRILGECGHFIDWILSVAQSPLTGSTRVSESLIHLEFGARKSASIHYSQFGNGKDKEQIILHQGGNTVKIIDFRDFQGLGKVDPGKGHPQELKFFFQSEPKIFWSTCWETVFSNRVLLQSCEIDAE